MRPVRYPKDWASTPRLPKQASGSYPFGAFHQAGKVNISCVTPPPRTSLSSDGEADSMEINSTLMETVGAHFIKTVWSPDRTDRFQNLLSDASKARFQNSCSWLRKAAAICTQSSAKLCWKKKHGQECLPLTSPNEITRAQARTHAASQWEIIQVHYIGRGEGRDWICLLSKRVVGFPGQQRPFHFNGIANANAPGQGLGGCVVVILEPWGGMGTQRSIHRYTDCEVR